MNVQELIDQLQAIEDKTMPVAMAVAYRETILMLRVAESGLAFEDERGRLDELTPWELEDEEGLDLEAPPTPICLLRE